MTLTQEQKQALLEKTASAKTQSKLKDDGFLVSAPDTIGEPLPNSPVENFPQEVLDEDVSRETSVDEIPWNGQQPFHDDELGGTIRSLVPMSQQAIVEGFTIPPGMNEDEVLDLSSAIYTYIGPIPVHIGRYTNKWFKVLGCCVQPLEGDVINERTGEVEHIKWERPLFKLDKVDPDTGENIIAYGGGIRGLQIARHFNAISGQFGWTVGDFKRPRMFYVQQENRENAHVMYGFRHRACTDEELGK